MNTLQLEPMTKSAQPSPDDGSDRPNQPNSEASRGGTVFTKPTPGGKEKTIATLFGEVVWLFTQSPKHKTFFLQDLEWLVMAPLMLKQFRVFYGPDRPIGVAMWGYVSEAVEQRLVAGNARLSPADWQSGERLWLVDLVAPYGGQEEMVKDLKEKVFPERAVKALGIENNELVVKTY